MANRRSVLIGLGSLVAGGGALLSTGAFTTVTAERTVNIDTTGDAGAFLGLEAAARPDDTGTSPGNTTQDPNENEYVVEDGETIQINLDGNTEGASGLNQNAETTFRNLVSITNNGTQDVDSISFNLSPTSGSLDSDTIRYTVDDSGTRVSVNDDENILGVSDGDGNSTANSLGPGNSIEFGMIIDLIGNSLATGPYTLTITAETADSQ